MVKMLTFGAADLERTLHKFGISMRVFEIYNGTVVELVNGNTRYELDAETVNHAE